MTDSITDGKEGFFVEAAFSPLVVAEREDGRDNKMTGFFLTTNRQNEYEFLLNTKH
jgi:hypothetical protein